jgi:hypothetical protein
MQHISRISFGSTHPHATPLDSSILLTACMSLLHHTRVSAARLDLQ